MRLLFVLLLATAMTWSACSSDDGGAPPATDVDDTDLVDVAPDPEDATPDTSEEATPDTGDDEVDAPDAFRPEPDFRETTVEVDGTTVEVSFEPFSVTVRASDGTVRMETRQGGPTHYAPLAIGVARRFDRALYYDPDLRPRDGAGNGITWYAAARLLEAEALAPTGARFTFETEDEDGEAGPVGQLEVLAAGPDADTSVQFRVTWPDDPRHIFTVFTFALEEDEGVFGLGQQFDRVDNRGLLRTMLIQAEGASESGTNEVHVPVPFWISSRRAAAFVDDRHPGAVDVGSRLPDALRVSWASTDVTLHLMADEAPLRLVERYSDLTARPAHVPFWALAPQWWRNRNVDGDEVLSDARRARALGMPSTMMWIDRPWQSYYQNFRFNPVQFPNAEDMLAELRAMGFRTMLHHSPQVNVPGTSALQGGEDASEGLYDLYVDSGWVVTLDSGEPFLFPWGGGSGAFIDWSHPDAVAYVHGLIERVADLGVVGVKMDWDEFLQPNVGGLRINMNFHNGETNLTMKSWYSALYHKAMYEGFTQALGEPSYNIVRHGSPRDQQWSVCVWPGDLDNDFTEHTRGPSELQERWNVGGIPAAVRGQLSVGLSGFPCFNSDIGGYRNGQPEEEALLRWMAFGVFNGVMQIGGGGRSHMPWSLETPYTEEALDITRDFMRLRMELFPYVLEAHARAEATGHPVAWPLWFSWPDDDTTRLADWETQYLFGEDLLVSPVLQPDVRTWPVYLPEGRWIDWWTAEEHEGPVTLEVDAPLDQIPLFLRANALLPLADRSIDTLYPATEEDIVAYRDVDTLRLLLVPGDAVRAQRWQHGLEATWDPAPAEGGRLEVALRAVDEALDARMHNAPATLEVEVPWTAEAPLPHALLWTLVDAQDAVDVPEETDALMTAECVPCWFRAPERSRIVVRVEGSGTLAGWTQPQ